MSETSEKIARLLEDPESIKMISEIAESFMSGEKADVTEEKSQNTIADSNADLIPAVSENLSGELTGLFEKIEKNIKTDDIEKTVRLIKALQPYLSNKRSHSADTVVKYLSVLKNISEVNLSKLTSILGMFNN